MRADYRDPVEENRRPVLVVAIALILGAAACSSGQQVDGSSTPEVPQSAAARAAAQVEPAEFAALVTDEDVVTVNVHVPDEGSIPGTDTAVPFDQIEARIDELPSDRSTALAVYCRTGRMSAEAVETLRGLGYTEVTELRGGMEAWAAEGRELLPGPA